MVGNEDGTSEFDPFETGDMVEGSVEEIDRGGEGGMSAFPIEAQYSHELDYRLCANGPVTLYHRRDLLLDDVDWLIRAGYQVELFQCVTWTNEDGMHSDLRQRMSFPSYYGNNFDALNDCLTDLVEHDYGWRSDATGLVLVFEGLDNFANSSFHAAQTLLDIVARRARGALVFGERLMCLVQSDHPNIEFAPVGASPVDWNQAEFLDSNRGL